MLPSFTAASAGEVLPVGPTRAIIKIAGSATGGRLSVVEMHIDSDWAGPPVHVHEVVDHLWYVVAGQLDLLIGNERFRAEVGDVALVPAGIQHTFSTIGHGPARVLEVDSGRALDSYFRDLEQVLGNGPVDSTAVQEVMLRHDTRPVR